MAQTINREAEGVKGSRLQKLRALKLILEKINSGAFTQCYTALEADGDVNFIHAPVESIETKYLEEDKNYDTDSSFTFSSKQILNTMVIFLDVWIANKFDLSIFFGFYATNRFAKERNSDKIKALGIQIPEKGILQSVIEKDYISDNGILEIVKKLIIDYYEKSYEKQSNTIVGYLDIIKEFEDETWLKFLNIIEFTFTEDDDLEALEREVIEVIINMKFYDTQLEGKEKFIYAYLMDELDKRQNASEFTQKFLHQADIELTFMKAKGKGTNLEPDKTYEMWTKSTLTNDKRSIEDKLVIVCSNLREKFIFKKNMITSRSKIEEQSSTDEEAFLSLKYRIYEKCFDILDTYIKTVSTFDENTITDILDKLTDESMKEMELLSKKYSYAQYDNKNIIAGIIHNLFDECYLAFD